MNRRKSRGRDVHGILVLDKPAGITSNAALQQVKRLFCAKKVGHTGSLDPLATGALPLCFGEATKFSQFLLNADKHYQVEAVLGVSTDSGDAEGKVCSERNWEHVGQSDLENLLPRYRGEIEQVPSMFSAVKSNGQPLYRLARQGLDVPRDPRTITIFTNELSAFCPPKFRLDVHCSKGTYVRTLVSDIGEDLNCGAHVTGLRRTRVGSFDESRLLTMDQIETACQENRADELLLPTWSAVREWPAVYVAGSNAYSVKHGQPVRVREAPLEGWVRLCETVGGSEERFLGVGEVLLDGRVAPRRMIA
ncbi:MAG: tRNA pseudouridine(55) synthase TruB [Gammaproteobacteria bacterium]|nr:tRNA pseudouridine(55) synthase TruB [Gammaproteobacteria bacterium]MYD79319.1 tRNA pseudouridine(55) synthase TruB [Gammaproteobacteria bacterium]